MLSTPLLPRLSLPLSLTDGEGQDVFGADKLASLVQESLGPEVLRVAPQLRERSSCVSDTLQPGTEDLTALYYHL